ncbi:hypothetical protein HMPREF9120_02833, partial [Neisseria sp. oral taxon 020 str. F0370]
NTQPPEGGCAWRMPTCSTPACFNTQPPEGGCEGSVLIVDEAYVSTLSRPKAAANLV